MSEEYKRRSFGEWVTGAPRQPAVTERRAASENTPVAIVPPYRSFRLTPGVTESLSISAVYGAVNILNNWVSQMDLAVWRAGDELPTPSLISQPDPDSTQYAFVKKTVTSLALTGNAYWYVTRRQSDGAPLSLEVLNPLVMTVDLNNTGKKVYHYSGYSTPKTYTGKNIVHVMTFEVPGRLTGLSPVEANGSGLAGILALRAYADEWFGASGTVRQHITSAHEMDDATHEEYVRRIKAQKAANNGDLITDKNTTVENLALTPSDAMYLEQQQFSVTDIARWFGIPPYLLLASVDGNSMTYSNLQTDARLFVTSTLSGYMKPIEEAFSTLLPRGQVVRFRTEALLRADDQARYEGYNLAIAGGYMTAEYVAAKEGLPVPPKKAVAPEPVQEQTTTEEESTETNNND